MTTVKHSIRVVSRRTGLTAHAIRVWEKRYGAVTPTRTSTNRRLYSEEEIERLNLLHQATKSGHNIGSVAHLPTDQLRNFAIQNPAPAAPALLPGTASPTPEFVLEGCLSAIRRLDSQALEQVLERGAVQLGQHGLLLKVIAPLTDQIGELWRKGDLTSAHEHMATWILRLFLGRSTKAYALNGIAPLLIVATPAGQLHEVGAVMVAAAAADCGWKVTYLGASLPASEIAGVAIQNAARAVALSLVYPEDDPNLAGELQNLRRYLPPSVALIAGGRASPAYRDALQSVGAIACRSLEDLAGHLDLLRHPRL